MKFQNKECKIGKCSKERDELKYRTIKKLLKKEWFNKSSNIWRALWKYGNRYFSYIEYRTREARLNIKHDGSESASGKIFSDNEKVVVNLFRKPFKQKRILTFFLFFMHCLMIEKLGDIIHFYT